MHLIWRTKTNQDFPWSENQLEWKLLVCLESHLYQMMVCWGTQMKGSLTKEDTKKECFHEADAGERMFWYSRHVKGCVRKAGNYAPDSGSWSPGFLFHLAILCQQWACTGWPYIVWLSSTCGDRAIERNSPKNSSWGSCGSLPHSQMQAGWWALQFLQDWTSCWFVCGLSAERPGL